MQANGHKLLWIGICKIEWHSVCGNSGANQDQIISRLIVNFMNYMYLWVTWEMSRVRLYETVMNDVYNDI